MAQVGRSARRFSGFTAPPYSARAEIDDSPSSPAICFGIRRLIFCAVMRIALRPPVILIPPIAVK